MKYRIIKSKEQYERYCDILEEMVSEDADKAQDEIELLTLLIEKWDKEHNTMNESDPVELLRTLMTEQNLKAKDLVPILGLTKGTVSKILNYQKGLSKGTIRKLAGHFKVSQEAFNRPYKLKNKLNRQFRNATACPSGTECL